MKLHFLNWCSGVLAVLAVSLLALCLNAAHAQTAVAQEKPTDVQLVVDKNNKLLQKISFYQDQVITESYRDDGVTVHTRTTEHRASKNREADYFDQQGVQRTHRAYKLDVIGAIGSGGVHVREVMIISVLDATGAVDYKQYFTYKRNRWTFDLTRQDNHPRAGAYTWLYANKDAVSGEMIYTVGTTERDPNVIAAYTAATLPAQYQYWMVDRYADDDPTACCSVK